MKYFTQFAQLLFALLVLAASLFGGDALYDVRKAAWGMTLQAVEQSEESKPVMKPEDGLMYEARLDKSDTYLLYQFLDGKLVKATYLIQNTGKSNEQLFLEGLQWKAELDKKYGKCSPNLIKVGVQTDNPLINVASGKVTLECIYQSERSDILFKMYGSKYRVNVALAYTDTASASKLKRTDERKKASDF